MVGGYRMTTGSHIWIYFIQSQATRLIKIGRSGNPAARIKSLQTGSPENLVLVGMIRVRRSQAELEEIGLHRRFVRLRHHNEWFLPGTELLDFIGNLPKSQDVAVEFTLVETTPIPATANDMTL